MLHSAEERARERDPCDGRSSIAPATTRDGIYFTHKTTEWEKEEEESFFLPPLSFGKEKKTRPSILFPAAAAAGLNTYSGGRKRNALDLIPSHLSR